MQRAKFRQIKNIHEIGTHLDQFPNCLGTILKTKYRAPMMVKILLRPLPGSAFAVTALGNKSQRTHSMNQPVSAVSTNSGKAAIPAVFTQIQYARTIFAFLKAVRNDADYLTAVFQAALLSGLVGTPCITGNQHIALFCRLSAHFPGKILILRKQIPASH